MKLYSIVVSIGLVLALSACGTKDGGSSAPAKKQEAKQDVAAPAAIVVKVPLDANGNEIVEQAEVRSASNVAASEPDAAAAFAAGQSMSVKEELDGDSSSQSWYANTYNQWNTCGSACYGLYSNNYANGYGSYYGNSYNPGYVPNYFYRSCNFQLYGNYGAYSYVNSGNGYNYGGSRYYVYGQQSYGYGTGYQSPGQYGKQGGYNRPAVNY